jgi:sodium/bile acid cotransporter 7
LAWGAAILLAMMARDTVVGQELALGVLVAGATPCTLASAAVWTRRAGGNEAVAVLGTILTNLACFVVMPFWLVVTTGQAIEKPFADMATKLLVLIVAPIFVAQLLRLHRPFAHWATAHKLSLSALAQIGILFTVLSGAINAGLKLEGDVWRLLGWETGSMIVAVMAVHLIALFSGMGMALALRQQRADAIAVGIAGSQKTLMVGLTIAYDYFGGLAVLPIIVYHVGQLLADTLIADWLREGSIKLQPPGDDDVADRAGKK